MKIRYNIATGRKLDYRKFALTTIVVLVVAVAFFYLGFSKIAATKERFYKEKEELSAYKEEIEQINEKKGVYRQDIARIKGKWNNQIIFCKRAITEKLFPFIMQLNKIEELLPAGVYLSKISLSTGNKDKISFSIASHSEAKLTEAYEAFMRQKLAIRSEVLGKKDGLWKASLAIRIALPKSQTRAQSPGAVKKTGNAKKNMKDKRKSKKNQKNEVMNELKSLNR